MKISTFLPVLVGSLLLPVHAIKLNVTDKNSIITASKIVAADLMKYFDPSPQVLGLDAQYSWWITGGLLGSLVDYWFYTNDTSYNNLVQASWALGVGEDYDLQPFSQVNSEGNDDQAFWVMMAMQAVERNFPAPPDPKNSFLTLVQTVFNIQTARWDTTRCNGGLRWQIKNYNLANYNYKNTISNGALFQIAARLARYTHNQTYADWAEKIYDWTESVPGLVTSDYTFYDGVDMYPDCSNVHKQTWSYNQGVYLSGAAYMYDYTNKSTKWQGRVETILNATLNLYTFPTAPTNLTAAVLYERQCEYTKTCNLDETTFKAYLARWLGITTQLAPFTAEKIFPLLARTAESAAAACTGGPNGTSCGASWYYSPQWDGTMGPGQSMSALEVIQNNLLNIKETNNPVVLPPVTQTTGGTSVGNPGAMGTVSLGKESSLDALGKKAVIGLIVGCVVVTLLLVGLGCWAIFKKDNIVPSLVDEMREVRTPVDA